MDDTIMQPRAVDEQNYWRGYYDACRRLDTSVRMNKAQREIIQEEGQMAKRHLERLGVKFLPESMVG